jgi:hypothetical protein
MDLDFEAIKKMLPLESCVISKDKSFIGGQLSTNGMFGKVVKHDDKAGLCIKFHMSSAFEPHFWYKAKDYQLLIPNTAPWTPLPPDLIEVAVGGRARRSWSPIITFGVARSWMLGRVRASPGDKLETLVFNIKFQDLVAIWNDLSNRELERWIMNNDPRPRRPGLLIGEAVMGEAMAVRRPKMG